MVITQTISIYIPDDDSVDVHYLTSDYNFILEIVLINLKIFFSETAYNAYAYKV